MGSAIVCLWALFVVCQPRLRLKVFLGLAVVTSTLSRLVDLEYPADMAKAFFPLFFGFLILAGFLHPGPKRRLPWFSWALVALAAVSFLYIRNVLDFQVAFILRTQWLMITIAGLLVVRTIHDQKSLRYVLEGLLLGLAGGVLLTGSQFIVNPSHAFSTGFGRFSPYGANPNQIGLLFAMTIPIALYLTVSAKSNTVRFGLVIIIAIAAMQSALTLSRASMLIAALPSLPTLFVLCRHPGVIILAIVCAYVVGSQTIDDLDGFDLEHISTGAVEDRLDHTLDLLHVVEQRPMFGLLFAEFEHAVHDEINSHNAYVDLLYLGGYSLALPHFALFVFGHFSAWLTWVNRRGSKFDPLAVSMLAMFSFCVFFHGFVNGTILYPTYIWAFIHVLVLTFFLTNGLRLTLAVRRQKSVGQRARAAYKSRPGAVVAGLGRPVSGRAMPPRPQATGPRAAGHRPRTTRPARRPLGRTPLETKRALSPRPLRPINKQNGY
jgi:hypothetical protein